MPQSSTHVHTILELIKAFAMHRAEVRFARQHTRFTMPVGVYMSRSCRIAISYALTDTIPGVDLLALQESSTASFNAMCVKVPLLAE
jgi:hypothetical protein